MAEQNLEKVSNAEVRINKEKLQVEAAVIDYNENINMNGIADLFLVKPPRRLYASEIEVNRLKIKVLFNYSNLLIKNFNSLKTCLDCNGQLHDRIKRRSGIRGFNNLDRIQGREGCNLEKLNNRNAEQGCKNFA